MYFIAKTTTWLNGVVCLTVLGLSIYPGWLQDLLYWSIILGLFASPILVGILAFFLFTQYRRGNFRVKRVAWNCAIVTLSMLFTTYVILKLYVPRRFAFAACRGSFQQIVDEGVEDGFECNQSIGPFKINDCLVDERGGTFFRVHSGGDGVGPDIMSYGFCYKPNRHGTPFGASGYRTYPLGEGWY